MHKNPDLIVKLFENIEFLTTGRLATRERRVLNTCYMTGFPNDPDEIVVVFLKLWFGTQPRNVSERRMSERVSEDMSEKMSEDLSERMSEDLSERMSDRISEDLSERMSDRMSEDLSERMSDIMSERMSKDMSERMSGSCQQDVSRSVKLKVTGSSAGNKMYVSQPSVL